jgi:hypothetical protein
VSREDFVAVASRLFSIYILWVTIRSIPTAVDTISQLGDMRWGITSVAFIVASLLLASFLWYFPLTVARKLLPVMREPRSETAIDSSTALSIGITLIGIWFFASAIADTSYWLTLGIRAREVDAYDFRWSHEQIAGIAATAVELFIATWLLFGSSGIKRLLLRFRYGDTTGAR